MVGNSHIIQPSDNQTIWIMSPSQKALMLYKAMYRGLLGILQLIGIKIGGQQTDGEVGLLRSKTGQGSLTNINGRAL